MHKKVIFCTDGIFPHAIGGMQRHSRLLIEHLAKTNCFDITVIHPHTEKVFAEDLKIEELPVQGIDKEGNYLLECYKYSKRVYAILKRHPESIIYAQGLSVWHKCGQFKERLIVNPHGLEPYQALTKKDKLVGLPFRLIFNYIFNNSKAVVSLGGKLTEILKSNIRDSRKIVVIPNAVNAPAAVTSLKKTPNDVIQALFVSRFAHNKGIDVLMEAISYLNAKGFGDRYNFRLIGKGPLFEHYTTNYKLNNVEYLGFVDDNTLEKTYANSDIFVFPTLFEGMPTVVLEAMAKGLPVIVSDTGATAELVDTENGYLIPKSNTKALTQSLLEFSKLTLDQRDSLGRAAIQKVIDNFTWEKVALKHKDLFTSL